MKNSDEEQRLVRRYLLGEIADAERERVERRFMTDSEYREMVQVIEVELIDDYLAGHLSDEERVRFDSYFLATTRQTQKVEMAKALDRYFSVEAAAHSPPALEEQTATEPRRGFFDFLRLRNPVVAFSLAAALLFVALGSLLLVNRWRGPSGETRERARAREFQEELARRNRPRGDGEEAPQAGAMTLMLLPVAPRGGGELKEVTRSPQVDTLRLQLLLPPDQSAEYLVTLQNSGSREQFTIENPAVVSAQNGRAVSVNIPLKYLTRGDYLLELNGRQAKGGFEFIGGYSFRVLN